MRLATAEDTRTLVELMADFYSEAAALAEVRLFRVGLGVRAVCVQVDKASRNRYTSEPTSCGSTVN